MYLSKACRTQLSAVGDQAFPVAAARTWNDLPLHVTSASSLPVLPKPSEDAPLSVFFSVPFACGVTLVIVDTLIVLF